MVFSAQMGAIRSAELMKAWSKKMLDEPGEEEEEEEQGRAGGPETCATYLRINGSACSPFCSSEILIYQCMNSHCHAYARVVSRSELRPAGLLATHPCL